MRFGIMQGRLSPPPAPGKLQFFPTDNWEGEFATAAKLGFSVIEWIFDYDTREINPLLRQSIRSDLLIMKRRHEVDISSICADYFMVPRGHLTRENPGAVHMLEILIDRASFMGASIIGIPLLEEHLPKFAEQRAMVVKNLRSVKGKLADLGVSIALEVDLPVELIMDMVDAIDSPHVGVCYDTGNATTFRRDLAVDIRLLGARIKEMHIKDRRYDSTQSVELGSGDAKLPEAFHALKDVGFNGPCILQAWRSDDNFIADAARQLDRVVGIVSKL